MSDNKEELARMYDRQRSLQLALAGMVSSYDQEITYSSSLYQYKGFSLQQDFPVLWREPADPGRVLMEAVNKDLIFPYLMAAGFKQKYITHLFNALGDNKSMSVFANVADRGRSSVFRCAVDEKIPLGVHDVFGSVTLTRLGQHSATIDGLTCRINEGPNKNPLLVEHLFVGIATGAEYDVDIGMCLIFLDKSKWQFALPNKAEVSYSDRLHSFSAEVQT